MKSKIWLVVGLIAAWTSAALAQEIATMYPAAILPFQERGVGIMGYGNKVSDLLFASLVTKPEFYLVERAELQKLQDEQELNISGMVATEQAVQIGKLTGAQLLLTGSVIESDNALYLVAKVIGTENGRVLGVSAEGKTSEALAPLVQQLADKIVVLLAEQANQLVAAKVSFEDRIAKLKDLLGDAPRPVISISVPERHAGRETIDPAVESELARVASAVGFTVLDKSIAETQPDVLITGEGFSEFATRRGNLVCVKARVELKAVERETGKVLAVDSQTDVVVDLAEQIAGKTALQEAAIRLAARILPKLTK